MASLSHNGPPVIDIPLSVLFHPAATDDGAIATAHAEFGGIPVPIPPPLFVALTKFARDVSSYQLQYPEDTEDRIQTREFLHAVYNTAKQWPYGPPKDSLVSMYDGLETRVKELEWSTVYVHQRLGMVQEKHQNAMVVDVEPGYGCGGSQNLVTDEPPNQDAIDDNRTQQHSATLPPAHNCECCVNGATPTCTPSPGDTASAEVVASSTSTVVDAPADPSAPVKTVDDPLLGPGDIIALQKDADSNKERFRTVFERLTAVENKLGALQKQDMPIKQLEERVVQLQRSTKVLPTIEQTIQGLQNNHSDLKGIINNPKGPFNLKLTALEKKVNQLPSKIEGSKKLAQRVTKLEAGGTNNAEGTIRHLQSELSIVQNTLKKIPDVSTINKLKAALQQL